MKKRLDFYTGKLTLQQIVAGMNAASRNARRLFADAQTLFNAGTYPSSAALAILSIEEAGKISILRELSLSSNEKEIAEVWKRYRSHGSKNSQWILSELVAKGARSLDDLRPIYDTESDHPYVLDQVKQISFYTDCLGKAHWSEPAEVIDKNLAKTLLIIASVHSDHSDITIQELELWVKHLGPVWKSTDSAMKEALIHWYADMQRHGLKPQGRNDMEHFIRFGVRNSTERA